MTKKMDVNSLKDAQQSKIKELQLQQAKLKELQVDLEKLNAKINNHEALSKEDTKFIGNLGWLTAASVSIATLAATL